MIALDANVLARLLVGDDEAQARRAKLPFDTAAAERDALQVCDSVLVELVWALARTYGRARVEIVSALRALNSNATVTLESAVVVAAATDAYEQGSADFADCLLCTKAAMAGCEQVATFDSGMRGLPNVKTI